LYNFDEIIDRSNTNALNTDGFRDYIFHADDSMVFPYKDEEFIRMWVGDMEFATPQVVIDAIRKRLDRRIFGAIPASLRTIATTPLPAGAGPATAGPSSEGTW